MINSVQSSQNCYVHQPHRAKSTARMGRDQLSPPKIASYQSDSYRSSSYVQKKEEPGFWGKIKDKISNAFHNVKEFLKTPTGKIVAIGGAIGLGALLIYTPIIPAAMSGIGSALSGIGNAIAGVGGSIGGAVAGATAGQAALAASPALCGFMGGLAGGAIGTLVVSKLLNKPENQEPTK